jgi:hypothetical protein
MRKVVLSLLFAVSGCTSFPTVEMPAFPKFRAADPHRILLLASARGYLVQRGKCLGLANRNRRYFRTIIWPETASLTVDARGLLLTDSKSGAAVRLGDYIRGGGGSLPEGSAARLTPELTKAVPMECSANVGTINPGFRKAIPPKGS